MEYKLKNGKLIKYRLLNRLETADIHDEIRVFWQKYPEALAARMMSEKTMLKTILLATDIDIDKLNDIETIDVFAFGNEILENSQLSEIDKKKL